MEFLSMETVVAMKRRAARKFINQVIAGVLMALLLYTIIILLTIELGRAMA